MAARGSPQWYRDRRETPAPPPPTMTDEERLRFKEQMAEYERQRREERRIRDQAPRA